MENVSIDNCGQHHEELHAAVCKLDDEYENRLLKIITNDLTLNELSYTKFTNTEPSLEFSKCVLKNLMLIKEGLILSLHIKSNDFLTAAQKQQIFINLYTVLESIPFDAFSITYNEITSESCVFKQTVDTLFTDIKNLIIKSTLFNNKRLSVPEIINHILSGFYNINSLMLIKVLQDILKGIHDFETAFGKTITNPEYSYRIGVRWSQRNNMFRIYLETDAKITVLIISAVHLQAKVINMSDHIEIQWKKRVSDPTIHDESSCPVCLENYDNARQKGILSGCSHVVCTDCLDVFLQNGTINCPICRQPYFDHMRDITFERLLNHIKNNMNSNNTNSVVEVISDDQDGAYVLMNLI